MHGKTKMPRYIFSQRTYSKKLFSNSFFIIALSVGLFACCTSPSKSSSPASLRRTYTGVASWYGSKYHGRLTASGERFDMFALTAAHRFLPFGTVVRVVNLANGQSVHVRINDRGPFKKNRIIDLSYAAAKRVGMISKGVEKVRIEVVSVGTTSYK